jgi:hypothetical protein
MAGTFSGRQHYCSLILKGEGELKMRNNSFLETAKNFRSALLLLLVLLGGGHLLGSRAFAQTAPAALKAELKSSTEAKRVLADIGSRDFKRTKDAKLRAAAGRALDALKAVAKNTSPDREAILLAKFDRTMKDLKSLSKPTAADTRECDAHYLRCIEICKEIGSNCKLCGIEQNGCYLTKLAIEMTKNPDDPTP